MSNRYWAYVAFSDEGAVTVDVWPESVCPNPNHEETISRDSCNVWIEVRDDEGPFTAAKVAIDEALARWAERLVRLP